ncbi:MULTISPECIES: MerR family transcriptional regulator [Streptomyces]|uniref:DNA-binding transcriptional MerR regulator n=1 Tax=Streptomyces nymphaeiformis TaxID=2663842 RepID=A0A7W7X8Z4_9ACTN|nr:MerR family transcriptional regulator [Streptomyces nymphaeiformis]MBB4979849.1 DNA-binding transcriptional MerR regulator [Streptomyces nymphaeiformis]
MKIGELSRLTGVSVRALRYYEEEGLIRPDRAGNGYRDYCEGADEVVRQIRGLIDCGLPTRIIRDILPYLDGPADLLPPVPCAEMLDQVAAEREQLDRRIHCLVRNRNALDAYLKAARRAARDRT